MWKIKALPNMCRSPLQHTRVNATRRNYSPSALTKAFSLVIDDDESVAEAARRCGVPYSTLWDRVNGIVGSEVIKPGPTPFFTLEEENQLVEHLKKMAQLGYGYSIAEVVDIASTYAVSLKKRDKDHPLSRKWFYNFMGRWPELKVQKPRTLELHRAKATSREVVTAYFSELQKIMTKYHLMDAPQRIYNIDEKGLKQNHTPPKVVSSSSSTPSAVTSGKGSTITLIGCGNAIGQQIPPFFVFPGQRMRQELLQESLPGTDGTVTDSGWSNSDVFMTYLSCHFAKYANLSQDENQPTLVLYDGHLSHITMPLINWAKEHNISLFVLPAHTSHILQPLDLGCFGPFERIYNSHCHRHMREHSITEIDRYSICQLACKTYRAALSPENLCSSFKKAGIFPFNSSVVSDEVFAPSEALKVTNPSQEDRSCDTSDSNEPGPSTSGNQQASCQADQSTNDPLRTFFSEREKVIGKRDKIAKKRRCISSIVSGKEITGKETMEKIQKFSESKSESCKKPKQRRGNKIKRKKPHASSHVQPHSPLSDSTELDQDEDDLCCVCHRFRPRELEGSIYFTNWGQCTNVCMMTVSTGPTLNTVAMSLV